MPCPSQVTRAQGYTIQRSSIYNILNREMQQIPNFLIILHNVKLVILLFEAGMSFLRITAVVYNNVAKNSSKKKTVEQIR